MIPNITGEKRLKWNYWFIKKKSNIFLVAIAAFWACGTETIYISFYLYKIQI